MYSFIPHSENPHTGRKIIGALVIVLISMTVAYFAQSKIEKQQAPKQDLQQQNIAAQKVSTNQVVTDTDKQPQKLADVIADQNKQDPISEISGDQAGTTIEEAQAPISVPMGPRSKDPKTALEEARIFAQPQILEGKYIDVSLSHQNMVLFEDGQFVDAYLVSSGKAAMPTPPGTYHIQNKVPRAYSKEYGLYMPNWMALVASGKFGIHELPEWPNGYKEGAAHLGIPVSHGCVRLGVGAAKRVYDWADIGTTVIVHK